MKAIIFLCRVNSSYHYYYSFAKDKQPETGKQSGFTLLHKCAVRVKWVHQSQNHGVTLDKGLYSALTSYLEDAAVSLKTTL